MRIQFLGTAAAEAYPGLFCNCKRCQQARSLGGRNLRCRSSVIVNDDLLIDFGPDLPGQATRFGVDLSKVRDILITHSHLDHFLAFDFFFRSQGFRQKGSLATTNLWVNAPTRQKFHEQVGSVLAEEFGHGLPELRPSFEEVLEEIEPFLLIKDHEIAPHQTFQAEKYTIHTIDAHHNEPEPSMNFVVDDATTQFVYATDTGLWEDSEWDYLEKLGLQYDCIALDCTVGGEVMTTGGHHSNKTFLHTKAEFERRGLLKNAHRFLAHHFSHQHNMVYDDLVEYMRPHGVEVTYDGMILEI